MTMIVEGGKNKSWRKIILLAFLALIFLSFSFFIYQNYSKLNRQVSLTTEKQPQKVVSEGQVRINSNGFMPQTIKIKKGEMVTWTNQDNKTHQLAADPHPTHTSLTGLESDPLFLNDSYTFIFEESGTYSYHDHFNPTKLRGTVMVE